MVSKIFETILRAGKRFRIFLKPSWTAVAAGENRNNKPILSRTSVSAAENKALCYILAEFVQSARQFQFFNRISHLDLERLIVVLSNRKEPFPAAKTYN